MVSRGVKHQLTGTHCGVGVKAVSQESERCPGGIKALNTGIQLEVDILQPEVNQTWVLVLVKAKVHSGVQNGTCQLMPVEGVQH